jgi:hypothetical protein
MSDQIHRLRDDPDSPFLDFGPMLEIHFKAASTRRDVRHGMDTIPTGFLVIAQQGGTVRSFDIANWTPDLAFLEATAADTRVRGCFVKTEDPTDA